MKRTAFFIVFVLIVANAGWRVGGSLSSDALGMAVGMLFGVMAGIPTALLMLASQRREEEQRRNWREEPRPQIEQKPAAPAPVINITHNHLHMHGSHPSRLIETTALPASDLERMKREQQEIGERRLRRRSRQAEVEERHQLPGPSLDGRLRQFR